MRGPTTLRAGLNIDKAIFTVVVIASDSAGVASTRFLFFFLFFFFEFGVYSLARSLARSIDPLERRAQLRYTHVREWCGWFIRCRHCGHVHVVVVVHNATVQTMVVRVRIQALVSE